MSRKYYSIRNGKKEISFDDLFSKIKSIFYLFQRKDYFKQLGGTTSNFISDTIELEANIKLGFQPFPIEKWVWVGENQVNQVFDFIEFLFDLVSKPCGDMIPQTNDTGFNYWDYLSYDKKEGEKDFIEYINYVLNNYKEGFELSKNGEILSLGSDGLQQILRAEIIPYDENNVDKKVEYAINKWRKRGSTLQDRKEAIREIADVFEWLKKNKDIEKVLNNKDDSDLFLLANKFHIRHHNQDQKSNYDKNIWYSWMFHFYLATYHAVIRLLKKEDIEKDLELNKK